MRIRTLLTNSGGNIPTTIVAGDIVLYDGRTDTKVIVKTEKLNIEDYPADRYTPIGVIVIPPSHDVYGTGEGAMVSLVDMSCDNPDSGDTVSRYAMYWGDNTKEVTSVDTDNISTLENKPQTLSAISNSELKYVCVGYGDIGVDAIGLYNFSVFMAKDFLIGQSGYREAQSPVDSKCYSVTQGDESGWMSYYVTPSPYLEDELRNPVYIQTTDPSSEYNALAYFCGYEQTKQILENVTVEDWKSSSVIVNSYDVGNYPAACCCWRFHTEGTKQGDWFLPSMAELGYLLARLRTINETISILINTYGNDVGVSVSTSGLYWSSSEYSSDDARHILTSNGAVSYYTKSDSSYVRAFVRV